MRQESKGALDRELFGSGIQNASTEGDEQLFINLGRALWRNRFLLAVVGFVGGVAGLGASYLFDVRYTAYAQVMIDTRVSNDPGFTPGISGIPTSLTALESELEVLRSVDLVETVVMRQNLIQDTEFVPEDDGSAPPILSKQGIKRLIFSGLEMVGVSAPGTAADDSGDPGSEVEDPALTVAVRSVRDSRDIQQVGQVSAVYSISFTSRNARKAAMLANALAEEYINRQIADKLASLERSQQWLTARTAEVQQALAELGVALQNHLLETPFSPADAQTMNATRATLQEELDETKAVIERTEDVLVSVQSLYTENPEAAASLIDQPSVDLTLAMETGTEADLRNALETELAFLSAAQEQRRARIEIASAELDRLTAMLVEQALHDAQTRQIENEIRVNEAIYQDFVSQLSRRTQQDKFLDPDSRIISYARPPENPSQPRRTQMGVIVAFLALVGTASLICLREIFQTRMRTVREFEAATGLPLVGVIPKVPRRYTPLTVFRTRRHSLKPSTVAFARKLYASVVAEREQQPKGSSLQTRLGAQARPVTVKGRNTGLPVLSGERGQVIICIGSLENEGTSTLNLLVAAACGYAGEKVLLLDCDFWNSPHGGLAVSAPRKYIDAIFNHEHVPEITTKTREVGVDLIPAAQNLDDPTALLTSTEFKRFVGHLAENYDRIIIDCAPILKRIDTASICRLADLVLLAVRWNKTPRGAVATALKVLADVGVEPDALVATRIELSRAAVYGDEMFSHVREIKN